MKYRALIFLFFITISLATGAQSLFELTYHFELPKGREDYRAFMLREDDGTGLVRLEYYDLDTHTRNIVEMDIEEHFGVDKNGVEDSTILVLVGSNQQQIMGNVMYPPDNFVLSLNPETGYYEPSIVLSIGDDEQEDIGVLDDIRLLNQEDLTVELVSHYFTTDDEFFKQLFVNEVRGLTPQEKQTQLHLIVVANTEEKIIGNTCRIDKESVLKTYSELSEFLGIQFKPTVIADKDFSKVNVDNAINNLRPGNRDIVVFYYSGHGFNEARDGYQFPYLDLRDKSYQTYGGQYALNIEAVYQKIKAKGARLNLVLSDCCNNDPSQTNNTSTDVASTRASQIGWSLEKCKALFMSDQRQSILMTAASKGELSGGNSNSGGIFTFNFIGSLEQFIGQLPQKSHANIEVTWRNLVTEAQKQTINKANHTLCRQIDNSLRVCRQTPVYKFD
ncbi:MAG: hypothetical protein GC171_16225 [Terrimonas sp.]|nr:hypothetical protein [Terrimonas sp.]